MLANLALAWWLSAPQRLWTRWVEGYLPAAECWPIPPDGDRLGLPPGVSLPRLVFHGLALDYYRHPRRLFGRTAVGAAIFRFKYRRDLDSGCRLVIATARFLRENNMLNSVDLLVAAPSSPVFRDFSPPIWLSWKLAEVIGKPVVTDVFERTRLGFPQKEVTSARAKKQNIAGMFTISESRRRLINGCQILLIDDVCDSGHTLAELSGVLQAAGAGKITPFAFAETGSSRKKL